MSWSFDFNWLHVFVKCKSLCRFLVCGHTCETHELYGTLVVGFFGEIVDLIFGQTSAAPGCELPMDSIIAICICYSNNLMKNFGERPESFNLWVILLSWNLIYQLRKKKLHWIHIHNSCSYWIVWFKELLFVNWSIQVAVKEACSIKENLPCLIPCVQYSLYIFLNVLRILRFCYLFSIFFHYAIHDLSLGWHFLIPLEGQPSIVMAPIRHPFPILDMKIERGSETRRVIRLRLLVIFTSFYLSLHFIWVVVSKYYIFGKINCEIWAHVYISEITLLIWPNKLLILDFNTYACEIIKLFECHLICWFV